MQYLQDSFHSSVRAGALSALVGLAAYSFDALATKSILPGLAMILGCQLLVGALFVRRDLRAVVRMWRKPGIWREERGHVAFEVAFAFPLVFVAMIGAFTFGQTLFTYNVLQSSMRSAARYASLAPYDLPNGMQWEQEVKNMAVYGDPDPADGASVLAPGLTVDHVSVQVQLSDGEPTKVWVGVEGFEVDVLFAQFTFSKPTVCFPFLGRSLAP